MHGGLVLELGHAGELPEHGEAVEHPGDLGVLGHMRLDKQGGSLRIDAAGEELGKQLQRLAAQFCGVLAHGDGMLVHHTVDAVILVLKLNPVPHGAQIVAQVNFAAGLNAAENSFAILFHRKHPLEIR